MLYFEPVKEIINYINKNLTTKISLETLADHVHFSPYHFHRLFLLIIGEAPMEYIRRLRLRSASLDLLSVELNLIELALKYRFESQDGFCRAFKKYYGITPGEYRKLNIKRVYSLTQKESSLFRNEYLTSMSQQSNNPKITEEVHTIMYNMNIYEGLACNHDDKMESLNTLDKVLELSEKAKCSGLLSLETEIDIVQPKIFKKSIQMLIDIIEPDSLREILMNYILCGGFSGKELLIRILIIEGILAISRASIL